MVTQFNGPDKLGQELVRRGLLTPEQLIHLRQASADQKKSFVEALLASGTASPAELLTIQGMMLNLPVINLSDRQIDPSALKYIPAEVARRHLALPIEFKGNALLVALADPKNIRATRELQVDFDVDVMRRR